MIHDLSWQQCIINISIYAIVTYNSQKGTVDKKTFANGFFSSSEILLLARNVAKFIFFNTFLYHLISIFKTLILS